MSSLSSGSVVGNEGGAQGRKYYGGGEVTRTARMRRRRTNRPWVWCGTTAVVPRINQRGL